MVHRFQRCFSTIATCSLFLQKLETFSPPAPLKSRIRALVCVCVCVILSRSPPAYGRSRCEVGTTTTTASPCFPTTVSRGEGSPIPLGRGFCSARCNTRVVLVVVPSSPTASRLERTAFVVVVVVRGDDEGKGDDIVLSTAAVPCWDELAEVG